MLKFNSYFFLQFFNKLRRLLIRRYEISHFRRTLGLGKYFCVIRNNQAIFY